METETYDGAQEMKEEGFLDDGERSTFSTLSEKRRPAMRNLVNAMPLLCPIYGMNSINLTEKLGLGIGEDLSKNVVFVLTGPSYNVRMDLKDDPSECNVFGSSYRKVRVRALRYVMNPGPQKHVFRSALQFAHLYKALASERRKSKIVASKMRPERVREQGERERRGVVGV